MIGALALGPDMGIDLGIARNPRPRRELRPAIGIEGLLGEDLAGEADGGAHLDAIAFGLHVVEQDLRRLARILGAQLDMAPAGRTHGPDMGLEAMPLLLLAAVIG